MKSYGEENYHREIERVHIGILDLAQGDVAKVLNYVKAARQDYRDILYWAFYYDDDPFRLLEEPVKDLQKQETVSFQDVQEVRKATRGTRTPAIFCRGCRGEILRVFRQCATLKPVPPRRRYPIPPTSGYPLKGAMSQAVSLPR